jgi:AraC family transcriptional activator of pobA
MSVSMTPSAPPSALPAAAGRARRPRLPAYALYGQAAPVALADRLHCESIAERSRLHGWEIRPHRHEALFQLLVIAQGAAEAWLDGEHLLLQGPALISVPALAAHGFRFAPDIQGHVFTVSEPHLATLLQPHPGLALALLQLRAEPLQAGAASVRAAADALALEALGHAPWREAGIDAALLQLAVALARALPMLQGETAAPASRAVMHVQRLRALVEAQFRQQPSQAVLAAQLGITPTQLNRACRQVLGHPAQAVLHARLLRQAQRELAYTDLGVKQIAFELGFTDVAYFTRFFRRLCGHPPAAWRAAQRGPRGGVAV